MFYPWNSDREPRVPDHWALYVFRGRVEPFICETCKKPLKFREEYLHSFHYGGIIVHNKEECYKGVV